jgi:hypothetical protein
MNRKPSGSTPQKALDYYVSGAARAAKRRELDAALVVHRPLHGEDA